MEPDIEEPKNIYPFTKLPSKIIVNISHPYQLTSNNGERKKIENKNENHTTKDVYDSYRDCLRDKFCQVIPLSITLIVFTIILMCILRGTIIQWESY